MRANPVASSSPGATAHIASQRQASPLALVLMLAIGAAMMGCKSDPAGASPGSRAAPHAETTDAAQNQTPPAPESEAPESIHAIRGRALDAAVPPGLDAQAVAPLSDEALQRAKLTLEQVRAQLVLPDFLDRPAQDAGNNPEDPADVDADAQAGAAPDADPPQRSVPLATQRLYAAARQQTLEGKNAEAVRLLEAALRVSPTEPALLRMLSAGWATLGNRVRAMQYLRQTVAADPDDAESLALLGRFLVESGDPDAGLSALLAALDDEAALRDVDPSLPILTRFYLAAGLSRAGYIAASASQMQAFLDDPREGLRPSRYGAELLFLSRQREANIVAVGDLHSKLGDALAARRAYATAEQNGAGGADLLRRIVYTDLRLGRLDAARERIVTAVEKTQASPASLSLVEYAIAQGLPAEPLVEALRSLRKRVDDPDAVTLALAAALPRASAMALLEEHLDESPSNSRVFERWLALRLSEQAADTDRAAAITRTADAIDHDSKTAARRAGALLALTQGSEDFPSVFAQLSEEQRGRASVKTLEALVLAERDGVDTAHALLDDVLSDPDAPPLARIEKARLMAVSGDYAAAEALIATLDPGFVDPRLGPLRVGILLNLDRQPEALALLTELIAENPGNLRFVVEKARLLVRMDRVPDAEQTLLDAINREPKQEVAYAELLKLYDTVGGKLEDYPQNYQRLVRRMLQTIPRSRTAQLAIAAIKEAERDYDRAERILDALLVRNPDDKDAKLILIDVYRNTHREDKVAALIEPLLEAFPNDGEVVQAALAHFSQTGKRERGDELEERWLRQQPPSPLRSIKLAQVLGRTDRRAEALELLSEAMATDDPPLRNAVMATMIGIAEESPLELAEPRLTSVMAEASEEGLYMAAGWVLADQYQEAGRTEDFDRVMLAMLKRHPNDANLNNHLGYFWANEGRNLAEAERMIRVANEAAPEQSAFLDSMGWVLYKQQRFEQAHDWMLRATEAPDGDNPVIMDHLGDVLYRLGKTDDAVKLWEQARDDAEAPEFQAADDPELATIGERTTAKLEAVEAGADDVPVAPVVDMPTKEDAAVPAVEAPAAAAEKPADFPATAPASPAP